MTNYVNNPIHFTLYPEEGFRDADDGIAYTNITDSDSDSAYSTGWISWSICDTVESLSNSLHNWSQIEEDAKAAIKAEKKQWKLRQRSLQRLWDKYHGKEAKIVLKERKHDPRKCIDREKHRWI